jgi:outer membrane protein
MKIRNIKLLNFLKVKNYFSSVISNKTMMFLTGFLVLYAAVISTLNFIGTPKVGYIDSSKLMEKYPPAITAREEFNKKSLAWKENTKTLEDELVKLNQELLENSGKWNKNIIDEKQEKIKQKQMEYSRYGKAINDKAAELEKELFEPVYTELNNKINEFGSNKGYEIIFGTLAGGNILYANNATDLTEEFLSYASVQN